VRVFDRWNEVERLFNAALEHNSAHRTEFLSNECTDPDVLAEVLSLLEAHEKGTSAFDRPPDKLAADLLADIEEQQDSLIGSHFDHYEIIGLLGKGGMGRVYLAHDSRLMRRVALKVLPSSQVRSMDGLRRFAQEARLASALNHPNIITVYDYGEAFSSYFIATEYVEGPTLRALIEQRPALEKALDICIQIASALAVAHHSGIIHRDIKPENIIVRADGLVKVLDFGLAKSSSGRGSTNTLLETPESIPGAIIGTFHYMSPEQARGQELDARTDIFSFGIVLYEMLAGRRPIDGDTLPDLLDALVRKDAPLLSTFVPDIPVEVEAIAARTLARDRDHRYQTFEAVLADLSSVKRRLDVGEKLEPASRRAAGAIGISKAEYGSDTGGASGQAQTSAGHDSAAHDSNAEGTRAGTKRLTYYLAIGLLLLVGTASYRALTNLWPFERRDPSGRAPIASSPLPITKGKANSIVSSAVSRNGKYFAYAQEDKVSILTMPITGQDIEQAVRPPLQRKDCSGLTFSNDGSYLYWVAPTSDGETHNLYRILLQGEGVEEKIKDDVSKSISFSPDGTRFAFVRNSKHALMIANADGSDEWVLSNLKDDGDLWLYPAWSPDNKVVACGVMNVNRQAQGIYAVSFEDRSMKSIGKTWVTVLNLEWMPGTEAIIANAAEDEAHVPGLWYISYPEGKRTKLTNDPNGYYGASLASGSGTVVSVRKVLNPHLYVAKEKGEESPREIDLGFSSAYGSTGLCWARDGKIVYNAGPVQRKLLYEIDPTSPGEQGGRPLTVDASDSSPSVTADNRYVVFASDRSGRMAVWRVDRDGGNALQLADDGLNPSCLLEGKSVVYQVAKGDRIRLWKVPIDGGGAPEPLTDPDVNAENAAVSPDGKRIAFLLTSPAHGLSARAQIAIIDNGKLSQVRYDLPKGVRQPVIRWRDDGMLIYIDQFARGVDIWQQPLEKGLDGGGGRSPASPSRYALPGADFKCIFNFDLSQDGRIVLSAGDPPSAEVYELILTAQS
jgi:serine/threonine protein kinase